MKKKFIQKDGKLTEKKSVDIDLDSLDLGSTSKLVKGTKPSKLNTTDLAPSAINAKPKPAPKPSGVTMVEQYFTDLGVPERLQQSFDGTRLNHRLLVDDTDETGQPLPVHFRFVSSRDFQAAKARTNGYTEVRIDPKTRKLSKDGILIAPIGDRKTGRTMQLMVQRQKHFEQRNAMRQESLEQRQSGKSDLLRKQGLEVAEELGVRPQFEEIVIDRTQERNISEI